jgi:hypothetical protein
VVSPGAPAPMTVGVKANAFAEKNVQSSLG